MAEPSARAKAIVQSAGYLPRLTSARSEVRVSAPTRPWIVAGWLAGERLSELITGRKVPAPVVAPAGARRAATRRLASPVSSRSPRKVAAGLTTTLCRAGTDCTVGV